MAKFFPRHTHEWKLEEPAAFRRLTLSLVEMALLTGVALRLLRAVALSGARGESGGWFYIGGLFALSMILLLGAATLHLGNYTLRQWVWRAPAFGAIEALAEILTSAVLVALGREPIGTGRATWGDWFTVAGGLLVWRTVAVSTFALILGGIVRLVRRWLEQSGTPVTEDTPAPSQSP